MGLLHLALDLRFADHHRIEAGRDAEEVQERLVLVPRQRVLGGERPQVAKQVVRARARVGDREHFQPVAGGEQHGLAHSGEPAQAREAPGQVLRGDGELLAHGDGHLLVREPDAEEDRHRQPLPGAISAAAAAETCCGAASKPA